VNALRVNIRKVNSRAQIIDAASAIRIENGAQIRGKNVLVIEDGPTLTHGEMAIGAGTVAAQKYGAASLIDPRPYVSGEMKKTFESYPKIGILLPAMGYSPKQVKDLEATINRVPADAVIIGTPIALARIVKLRKPSYRVTYDLEEIGEPNLRIVLEAFVKNVK
jgi:predicted GTPase